MVPRHLFDSDASQALFFSQSNIDQRIVNPRAQACLRRWSRQAIAAGAWRSRLLEEGIMIGSPPKSIFTQSAQSHDWDARATEVIAEARKMPLGRQRSDALGEAGRLRIAAEMNRWLSTK
jgi:hypothetical protein